MGADEGLELGSSICTVGSMDGLAVSTGVKIVGSDDGTCEVSENELG